MGKKICPLCGSDNIYEDFTLHTTIGYQWCCNNCESHFKTPTIITEITTNKIEKIDTHVDEYCVVPFNMTLANKLNEIIDRINEEEER